MVELATVVSFKEPNHKAKCSARKAPEKRSNSQSFFESFLNSFLFMYTIGSNSIPASHIRYMLNIVAGASDHLTKIAEKETAIIEIANGMAIDLDPLVCSTKVLLSEIIIVNDSTIISVKQDVFSKIKKKQDERRSFP